MTALNVGGYHRSAMPDIGPYPGVPLSFMERHVLRSAALGSTYFEIAQNNAITERGVKTHLEHAFTKLDVHCCIDAFRALGWLTVPDQ